MKSIPYKLTTDTSGDVTVTNTITGKLIAVEVAAGTLTTATISVTKVLEGTTSVTYFSKASCATGIYYPRIYAQTNAGVDLTYDATRKIPVEQAMSGEINVIVASGGNTLTGTVILHYE